MPSIHKVLPCPLVLLLALSMALLQTLQASRLHLNLSGQTQHQVLVVGLCPCSELPSSQALSREWSILFVA